MAAYGCICTKNQGDYRRLITIIHQKKTKLHVPKIYDYTAVLPCVHAIFFCFIKNVWLYQLEYCHGSPAITAEAAAAFLTVLQRVEWLLVLTQLPVHMTAQALLVLAPGQSGRVPPC
jgi:hypothetical protein